ncbi:hypothetical protein ACN24L_24560 [Streptomyces microflavus]
MPTPPLVPVRDTAVDHLPGRTHGRTLGCAPGRPLGHGPGRASGAVPATPDPTRSGAALLAPSPAPGTTK